MKERNNISKFNKHIILAFILIGGLMGFNSKTFADETALPFNQTLSGALTDNVISNNYTIKEVNSNPPVATQPDVDVTIQPLVKTVADVIFEVGSKYTNVILKDSNGNILSEDTTVPTDTVLYAESDQGDFKVNVHIQTATPAKSDSTLGDYRTELNYYGHTSVQFYTSDGTPLEDDTQSLENGMIVVMDDIGYRITGVSEQGGTTQPPNSYAPEDVALPLDFGQTATGFLSWNDATYVYKINVPKTGEVDFGLTTYKYDDPEIYISLLNHNNDEIFSYSVDGRSKNPTKSLQKHYLDSGTYYLKVCNASVDDFTPVKYDINVFAPYLLPSIKLDEIGDNTTKVAGTTDANQQVSINISGKVYTGKANRNGHFSITIPKQKVGTKVDVSVKNSYGTKKTTVTVVDRTAPAAPKVGKLTTKSKYVTGKAESGATIYIYNGSKKIGSAKVTSKGTYQAHISTQKKGTILTIYVQDIAGKKSKTIQVKVQ